MPLPYLATKAAYADPKTVEVIEPARPVRVKDQAMLEKWQNAAFLLQENLRRASEDGKPGDAKAYAIAAGVATDKVLLLAGRPTSIVAGLHAIQASLPDLARTLARVAERLAPAE
jgi:cob(I)alamin adenosyltransferase